MAKALQVHLMTPASSGEEMTEVHQMTWVDAGLKPTKGMVVEVKGDKRPWTVVSAYTIVAEMDGLPPWKEVGQQNKAPHQ